MELAKGYRGYEIMRRDDGTYFVREGAKFIANCFSVRDGTILIDNLHGEF